MTATLESIHVYPVKSLDGIEPDQTTVREAGGLAFDREYAIRDGDGEYVNGKRERAVHRLASSFDPDTGAWTVGPREGEREAFQLPEERAAASNYLSDHFGYAVTIDRDPSGGFPDDTHAAGPTLISRGTLETVASWYDDIDATAPAESHRRRRRAVLGGQIVRRPRVGGRVYHRRDELRGTQSLPAVRRADA